ncbi:MAG: M28 family peptidase, partial [Sphingobacteriaceae bacterium]
DGEEPGLIGSTEWAETHAAELQQKLVAYINSDGNGRGFLGAGGSQALEGMMTEVAKDVTDPQTNVSVFERNKARDAVRATSVKAKKEALASKDLKLESLGSGSDYSSFLQHLGIPSLNLGFGGEDAGGEYHSIYDSFDDYRRFKDPDFAYGVALAKVAGRAELRLADADVLPFDFRSLQKTIAGYVAELISMTDQMRETTSVDNQLVKANDFDLAADHTKPETLPKTKEEVPFLDFSGIQNAVAALDKSSGKLAESWSKQTVNTNPVNLKQLNKALYQAEQQLLTTTGLPRRAWYKHSIYAPGFYTGYGVKTMPGIREAIEQRNWKEAQEQLNIDAGVLNKFAAYLNQTAALAK